MANNKQKLELTWIGKDNSEYDIANIEPRILEENADLSNCEKDPNTENMIIHGDNLLALKALLPEYEGKIKCIYMDPPYNTGNAFEHYDDSVEHSTWLSLMKPRLELLKMLLSDDGVLCIQLDDVEQAYLKVLLDEVFGRSNFINQVSVKMKQTAGASGGGEDKRLKKNIEYILIYTKNYQAFPKFNEVLEEENLFDLINEMRDQGKSWKYTRVFMSMGSRSFFSEIQDGSGLPIKIYKHSDVKISTIPELMKAEGLTEEETYFKYFDKIFRDTNAQSSIRTRVMDATKGAGDFFSIDYVPRSGKSKGQTVTSFYKGNNRDLIAWLKDVAVKKKNSIVKLEKLGTYWEGFPLNNLTKEGGVLFPNGKKPEALVQRILDLISSEGDFVLDSFLGSGTTTAVAHKTGRKYIGIEMGDHAYTHCKVRMDKVIDGSDQGGISRAVEWQGGGGYKFYELAPSFITKDEFGNAVIDVFYDDSKLIKAMCKLMSFAYQPSKTEYWKHGVGQGKNYLYVTTQLLTSGMIQQIAGRLTEGESLIICPKKFEPGADKIDRRITIKKIPQSILKACHFGKKEYLLPIKESAVEEIEIEAEEDDNE
ncbi:MAG: site-specific DNA-methyltransferase [Parcubacteria group bacterium]|jgi:adenine-specific DNA-methyltransferase